MSTEWEQDAQEFIDLRARIEELEVAFEDRGIEVERLRKIILTDTCCAYCGAAYPQGTPRFGGDALTEHIKVCPRHPMRQVEERIKQIEAAQMQLETAMDDFHQGAIYDFDDMVLRMSGYQELKEAIKKMVAA